MRTLLEKMPDTFTSHQFLDGLREMGVSITTLKTNAHLVFLEQNCIRTSIKTWRKKSSTAPPTLFEDDEATIASRYFNQRPEMFETASISFLKERGYTIYKTITVEV
jgi:hypothetical protein